MSLDTDALRRILNDAASIRNTLSHRAPQTPPPPPDIPFTPLHLHIPDNFHQAVQELQLHAEIKAMLSQAVDELKLFYEKTFSRVWNDLWSDTATHPVTRSYFPSLIERFRLSLQARFEMDFDQLILIVSEPRHDDLGEQRQSFNNDYIPFLQRYFEYDSYPSVHDREIMAQKSGMTARQIEVWFQNHRRVARKTGAKITKRETNDSNLSFTFIPHQIPARQAHEEKMQEIEQQVRIETAQQELTYESVGAPRYLRFPNAVDLLNPPAPSYAFPTKFKTPAESQQFQHRDWRPHFPPPEWLRRQSTVITEQPRSEDEVRARQKQARTAYKEMHAQFALLSVRDTIKGDVSKPPAATFAVYLTPSPAPHPSLLRASGSTPSRISSASSAQASQTSRRRKVAALPKRTPKNPMRRSTPYSGAYAKTYPSRNLDSQSTSSPSRTPSLEADASSSPQSRTPSLELPSTSSHSRTPSLELPSPSDLQAPSFDISSPSSSLSRHGSVSSLSSLASTSSTDSLFPLTPNSSNIDLPSSTSSFCPPVAIVDPDIQSYFDELFAPSEHQLFPDLSMPMSMGMSASTSMAMPTYGGLFDESLFSFDGAKDALNPSLFGSFSDFGGAFGV